MDTTTIKLHKTTKSALDSLKNKGESYDIVITKLVSKEKQKSLKNELIEAYKSLDQEDLEFLKEWETASKELDDI